MLMRVMSVKTKELSEKATKGKKLHKVKETGNNFGGNKHH